ncbi:unnamed protein product [Alopecurus aequalis]
MAALRHAGRRLVGGGGLPQALNRPIPAPAPAGFGSRKFSKNLQSHDSEKAYILRQVQQKKELLYNLICEHADSAGGSLQNFQLLHHLSAQVKPKPNDFAWVYLRITHAAYVFCIGVSPVVTLYGSWICGKTIKDKFVAGGEE